MGALSAAKCGSPLLEHDARCLPPPTLPPRVTIRRLGDIARGVLVALPETFQEVRLIAAQKLGLDPGSVQLFLQDAGELQDDAYNLVRDGDFLEATDASFQMNLHSGKSEAELAKGSPGAMRTPRSKDNREAPYPRGLLRRQDYPKEGGMGRPFVCPHRHCGKTYKNFNGLKYHLSHRHLNPESNSDQGPDGSDSDEDEDVSSGQETTTIVENGATVVQFRCSKPNCECVFATKKALKEHRRHVHGAKPFKCTHHGCGKAYGSRPGLKYHLTHAHNDNTSDMDDLPLLTGSTVVGSPNSSPSHDGKAPPMIEDQGFPFNCRYSELIEVLDRGVWHQARILYYKLRPAGMPRALRVHYIGWTPVRDESIELDMAGLSRLRPWKGQGVCGPAEEPLWMWDVNSECYGLDEMQRMVARKGFPIVMRPGTNMQVVGFGEPRVELMHHHHHHIPA
ncbi:hypothetical protein HK104_005785 [Borealophlyctis nickersoniae]|nr:hypothetical protein HK104_005785 [Borealophlyctis nickersoniae]